MIIDLRTFPHGSRRFEFCLEEGWWRSDERNDQIVAIEGPLEARMEIYRASDKYVLNGDLSGGLRVRCARCLEPYHRDLKTTFQVYLALPLPATDETEVELEEEDMEVDFIRGEEIDLDEIIREQIYLSIPMKLVCRKDCQGLCPRCGVNLNEGMCRCREDVGHPGFLKLKDLKIQGD
jgi:uncharacterized protein